MNMNPRTQPLSRIKATSPLQSAKRALPVIAAIGLVYLVMAIVMGAWQLFVVTFGILLHLALHSLGLRAFQRGRDREAAILILIGGALDFMINAALVAGLGIALGLAYLVFAIGVFFSSLPPDDARRVAPLALIPAIAMGVLSVFPPAFQLEIPWLKTAWPILLGLLIIAFVVVVIRQFESLNLRTRMTLALVLMSLIVGLSLGLLASVRTRSIAEILGQNYRNALQEQVEALLQSQNRNQALLLQSTFMQASGTSDQRQAALVHAASQIAFSENGFAILLDSQGRPLSMPFAGWTLFNLQGSQAPTSIVGHGSEALQQLIGAMLADEQGLGLFDVEGESFYLAYTPLTNSGLYLGLVVSQDELLAPTLPDNQTVEDSLALTQSALLLIVPLVMLALVIPVRFLAGRALIRPIEALTAVAQQIAGGNLNVRSEITGDDELGILGRTLNKMTYQLRELFDEMEARVAERTKALALSAAVSRRISNLLDREELVLEVVKQIQWAFDYYHVHIYLFDEDRQNLIMVGGSGDAGARLLTTGHRIPKGKGLVGRAAEQNAPVLVPETAVDPDWLPNPLLPETQSEIAVPIASGHEVLGVLDVQHNVRNGLRLEDVELLEAIANQLAIALHNAKTYIDAQQRAQVEGLVNQITDRIQRANSVERAIQTAVRELGRALGAERTAIQLVSISPAQNADGERPS